MRCWGEWEHKQWKRVEQDIKEHTTYSLKLVMQIKRDSLAQHRNLYLREPKAKMLLCICILCLLSMPGAHKLERAANTDHHLLQAQLPRPPDGFEAQ